jgi:hypothetical protein
VALRLNPQDPVTRTLLTRLRRRRDWQRVSRRLARREGLSVVRR